MSVGGTQVSSQQLYGVFDPSLVGVYLPHEMFDAFGDNLMSYFSDKNAKLDCNLHMCSLNDSCSNIKKNITKAFDTKIELKSSG